ncbi:NACHT domain-containing protein [Streptomyces sp. CB02460]|uniref:NACHT domain-containing protein n=1 Tax=Streptomyces sp. CB02460 TaxID=1703941 RepID=UPI00093E075B
MTARSVARTLVVQAAEQGSGVLVSPCVVLTCAHVLGDGRSVRVVSPELGEVIRCRVVWSDRELDAALLLAERTPLPPASAERLPHLRLGRVSEDSVACTAVGFPLAMRDGGRVRRDTESGIALPATYMPGTHLRMDLKLHGSAAADRADGLNPLAGFSGGPVVVGDVLVGHIIELPDGRANTRLVFVPVPDVLAAPGARAAWQEHAGPVPPVEPVLVTSYADQQYEPLYMAEVRRKYRTRGVIGLEGSGPGAEEVDLDPSYIRLRATTAKQDESAQDAHGKQALGPSQGVHALLAAHRRVLLTGKAGSGKTTIVSWLARSCASPDQDGGIEELRARIPIVVKLREVHARDQTLPPLDHVHKSLGSWAPRPPENWARRVLDGTRGLLLVDGLDEIPATERERVRQELDQWLDGRDVRCVVTSRPGDFLDTWRDASGFTELRLQDMDNEEMEQFVGHWYRAAHRIHGDDGDWRTAAADLTRQIKDNGRLEDLAGSPLLCAALCALHRAEQRELPTRLWDLLDRTLAMLLGRRDRLRTIASPEGVPLDDTGHRGYLQPIAAWLVRGGQNAITRQQALRQIELTKVDGADGWPGPAVLEQLLRRTILRVGDGDDLYQFVHRTFQDFLAAAEIARTFNVSELLRNARDSAWQEVIRLSVGHWRRDSGLQRQLIDGLLKLGDEDDEEGTKADLYVLAAACAFNCDSLEAGVETRVRHALEKLLPPSPYVPSSDLGSLGLPLLRYLPPQGGLSAKSAQDLASIVGTIGGEAAMPLAAALASLGLPDVNAELAAAWRHFPSAPYAREVLAGADLSQASLSLYTPAELEESAALRPVQEIWIRRRFPVAMLRKHLVPGFSELDFLHPELTDLGFLGEHGENLEVLWLREPSAAVNLSVIARCRRLQRLYIEEGDAVDASFLGGLPELRNLDLRRRTTGEAAVHHLARPSRLESLSIVAPSLSALRTSAPLPNLRLLNLQDVEDWADLGAVRESFPYLTFLSLDMRPGRSETLDLSPLHRIPDLSVSVYAEAVPSLDIQGAGPFGDRFMCTGLAESSAASG